MNKEVSFELAKLLKEKGFDEPCSHAYKEVESPVLYIHQDRKYNNSFEKEWQNTVRKNSHMDNAVIKRYSAPTIAEVVMWLYKKHGVWINPTPSIIEYNYSSDTLGWVYNIFTLEVYLKRGKVWGETNKGFYKSSYYYDSPAEAYEAAITYCLNNLV